MAHSHNHEVEVKGKKMIITMFLNFSITAAEIVGGLISGSLSLISDALHNLSDGISVIITYIALKLSGRENTEKMTFGYKRSEILAALFNASVLMVISVFLFREAYVNFLHPKTINGAIMTTVAVIGLAANTISVFLLKKNAKENINIKSTYLHLLSDALSSVGVIIGGIMITFFKIYWIDPLLTVVIGAYVLKESFAIVTQAIKILMQAAPDDANILKIKEEIEKIPEVENIHHLHIWSTNEHDVHIEFHVKLHNDIPMSKADELRRDIETILKEKFQIQHSVIQMEYVQAEVVDLIKKTE